MQPIQGIHHITVMASDPQKNIDFYTQILGQRFVKRTVNFDDNGTYHLYYGDHVGSPGTIMTYFPWPGARQGRIGNGEVAASAYNILPSSVDYWEDRLQVHGVAGLARETRFHADVLSFLDPDGMHVELITHEGRPAPQFWADGPIPEEHALRGFHGVTVWVESAGRTSTLLVEQMGYSLVGEEGENAGRRLRFKGASNDHGMYVDLVERPGLGRGQMGAGTVHHVAFRVANDAEQAEAHQNLSAAGIPATEVKDRCYFRSIYFREPGGTIFEIATDEPGFPVDEPIDQLGKSLMLPPWLEAQRVSIAARLPQIEVAEYSNV
jgi:glyoxalase family protein